MSHLPSVLFYKITVYIFLFSVVSSSSNGHNDCNFKIRVTQKLLNEGYHRNLTYTVQGLLKNLKDEDTKESWLQRNCLVVLEQGLPSGIYGNPDELSDLRRSKKASVITKDRVNIELPAEMCGPTTVYAVRRMLASSVDMWIPLHARYHKAIKGGGTARNDIEKPKVHIRCSNYSLDECNKNIYKKVKVLCNEFPKEECSWMNIPYDTGDEDTVVWYVPVGNLDHYYVVSSVTTIVVLLASLYLAKTLHDFKISFRDKNK